VKTKSGCFPRASSITDRATRFITTNRSSRFLTRAPGMINTELFNSGTCTSHSQRNPHTSCSRHPVLTLNKVVGKDRPHALASFVRTININLIGSFNITRLAAEATSPNAPNAGGEHGVIVFTASVAAFDGQIGQPA
jgi:hypothetical protein